MCLCCIARVWETMSILSSVYSGSCHLRYCDCSLIPPLAYHYSHLYCLLNTLSRTRIPSAGKPWTYRLEIKRAANLPVFCEMAYVSYDFFGEAFTTGSCINVG